MSPERWKEIERIYQSSVELPPDRRAQFLAESCNDEEIRQEVESLLAHCKNAPSFIERRALDVARDMMTGNPTGTLVGRTIGPYEVRAFVAAGGMGDVYRARDSRLNRDVALKVLPDQFSEDSERVRRSEREAKLLASLNHPNIAAIYDLEESDGIRCLVLEFVEGQTLAERLKRGRLPLDEALDVSRQIALALEAAHEQGIVHRDLKPGNIMIVANGAVKVLDFGIAKMLAPETEMDRPTVATAGVVLGTPSYMSPEQAQGKPTDKRTDIWAFGCVLYELLTGRQAFQGESVTDTLAAVLTVDPDWNRLPEDSPAGIRRLIGRCLRKDRNRRLQTVADARIEIEDARAEPGKGQAVSPARSRRSERLAWIVASLLAVSVAAALGLGRFGAPAEAPEMRLDITTPPTASPNSFAISPDGRQLAYVATRDGLSGLWIRSLSLDSATARPLPGTEGVGNNRIGSPIWSPDGGSLAFVADGVLKRIDIDGRSLQTITGGDPFYNGVSGEWSPEGVILFSTIVPGSVRRIPASGGEAVVVANLNSPQQTAHNAPSFLPGGRQFIVASTGEAPGIYLGSTDSAEIKRLVAGDITAAYYAPQGWLFFLSQGTLAARRFDIRRGELAGESVIVAQGVGAFKVSASGTVAYRSGGPTRRQLTWLDRSGKAVGTLGGTDGNSPANPELSPDGRRVAVNRLLQGNWDVWIVDPARERRLTLDPGNDLWPLWSPDAGQILFSASRGATPIFYQKPSSSSAGADTPLVKWPGPGSAAPLDWSPDGHFLLFESLNPKADLWIAPSDAGGKPEVFLTTNYDNRNGRFSPNGHWVAYQSNETGRYEIYVRPFPKRDEQLPVSTSGGFWPRWRHDGKELYYVGLDGKMMAVSIADKGTTIESGIPIALFQTPDAGNGIVRNRPQYDVAPDGRFLFIVVEDAAPPPITLLLNWKPPTK